MQLILQNSYETGIRELSHIAPGAAPGRLYLADRQSANVWEFDCAAQRLLRRYQARPSRMQRALRRPAPVGWALPAAAESAFAPLHQVAALTTGSDGTLCVLDRQSTAIPARDTLWRVDLPPGRRARLFAADFFEPVAAATPELKRLALASYRKIIVLDLEDGERPTPPAGRPIAAPGVAQISELPGYADGADDLALSPDGRLLACTGHDADEHARSTVRLYDVARLVELNTWRLREVACLAFHPAGQYVAAGCVPAVIKLWDTLTFQITTLNLKAPVGIGALAFSPDGGRLYAGDWLGKLMHFSVAP